MDRGGEEEGMRSAHGSVETEKKKGKREGFDNVKVKVRFVSCLKQMT